MKMFFRTYGSAILSGFLLALAFPAWDDRLFPLAWVALVPLLLKVRTLEGRAAFFHFVLAGWVFNLFLLHWLMTNVYWAGGWAFWGYVGLSLLLALFWGATGLVWRWIGRRTSWAGGAAGLAVFWVVMEFLQAHLFTGFGWGAVAYSQGLDLPLGQWAAVGGAPLVSALVVLCNGLIAFAIVEKGKRRLLRIVGVVAVLGVGHGVGFLLLGTPDYQAMPLKVGIVQPDFPLEMKWDFEYSEEMVRNMAEKSRLLAKHEPVDLFVWPEAAIVQKIETPTIFKHITTLTEESGAALFTGSQRFNRETKRYRNSSFLIDAQGDIVDSYDKIHLAPFGEYVPFSKYLPFIRRIVPAMSDIEPGTELKVMKTGGRSFGPLICFEVLFADLAEQLRAQGADFLVIITNLGWFGGSSAIPQEFELGRMRAIETRLPLVHCGNTGVSGVFDPWGRFTGVKSIIDFSGRYLELAKGVKPRQLIMQRVVGALPVAAPGKRPVPYGPRVFPWIVIAAAIGFIGYGTFLPQKTSDSKS